MRLRMPAWAARRPALALFLLAVTVYLLTAGVSRNGVGYSADGTFAFEMAKSVVVDPDHKYLRRHGHNFSRWGVGLPLALMPVVAAAESFAHLAPQRDRIPIGEHEILLVNYAPLGGMPQPNSTDVLNLGLKPGRYDRLALLTHTGLSAACPRVSRWRDSSLRLPVGTLSCDPCASEWRRRSGPMTAATSGP